MITRAQTEVDFVEAFWRFADESSIFLPVTAPLPVGECHPLRITLVDGTAVMSGEAEVIDAVTDGSGGFGRNGMRVRFLHTDDDTEHIHHELLRRRERSMHRRPQLPGVAAVRAVGTDAGLREGVALASIRDARASGSLPANPFASVSAEALEHFVDCTLCEDDNGELPGQFAEGTGPAAVPESAAVQATPKARPPRSGLWIASMIGLGSMALLAVGLLLGWLMWGQYLARLLTGAQAVEVVPTPVAIVVPSPERTSAAALAPAPTGCRATIVTSPPGAQASLDARDLGLTPLHDVEIGCKGTLTLDRPRYERLSKELKLSPGARTELRETLVRPVGKLAVASTPAGAVAIVNGKVAGKTPLTVKVAQYERVEVELKMAGFKPFSKQVIPNEKLTDVAASLEELGQAKTKTAQAK